MDCERAQTLLLDDLDTVLDEATRSALIGHLKECSSCRAFSEVQRRLDAELRTCFPRLQLDEHFRAALDRRLAAEEVALEWLPVLAYAVGGVLATAACILALPFPASTTWWLGGGLAGCGLFLHTTLAGMLDEA